MTEKQQLTFSRREAKEDLQTAIVRIERALLMLGLEGEAAAGGDSFQAEFRDLIETDPSAAVDVAVRWRYRCIKMKERAKDEIQTFVAQLVEQLELTEEQAEKLRSMTAE